MPRRDNRGSHVMRNTSGVKILHENMHLIVEYFLVYVEMLKQQCLNAISFC